MQATKDMTEGRPTRLLIFFALPIMFGNLFQQLYTIVDTIIVGQGVGVDALAAVGAADWYGWLFLWMAGGMTQGFSILFAQYYGAKDEERLKKAMGNSIVLSLIAAVLLTAVGEAFLIPMLRLLNTPEHIFSGSTTYLRIILGGITVVLFYNFEAALLRALGDSKTPLIAMIIASCTNIVLDLLFVMVFKWGIAGAAAATVIAQGVSCLFCLGAIRKLAFLQIEKEDFRLDLSLVKKLLGLGVPTMFLNSVISIGGMVLQSVINQYGVIFVAGFTATNKIYGLLEAAATSYGFAITTYVAQNRGAGKYLRIRKGVRSGLIMTIFTCLAVSALMLLIGENLLSLFISGEPEVAGEVLAIAYRYLTMMSIFLLILYALHLYRSALQGLGDTVTPMFSGIAEFVMRVLAAILLPVFLGQEGVFWAEIMAWSGACAILVTAYYVREHRLPKIDETASAYETH